MSKYKIIEVSNENISFYVIGAVVALGKDKYGSFVEINGKKIRGLNRIEFIREIEL